MCGIAGIFSRGRDQSIDRDRLHAMAALQRHRGPDNLGVETFPTAGFAHNRLSLLDLSSHGNQPFRNDRYALVYNGEIYNWKDLRSELERDYGIDFRSDCDTEVLFHLLIIHGPARTLTRLQGMFAFAFYDIERRDLTLARDRIGVKPLFFHQSNGVVSFASELKALVGTLHPEVDSQRLLNSALGVAETSRCHTNFVDTHQVEPGTLVRFSEREWGTKETWFTSADLVDADYYRYLDQMSSVQITEEFGQLLGKSVEKMLVADAPIGAFVSGGIDSSLIAALAAECGKNPRCYSVNVVGPLSEIASARILADSLGAELFEIQFHPEHFLRDWVRASWYYDAPLVRHQHAVPFCNLTQLAQKQGNKAVLTGEGADELFFGYSREVRASVAKRIPPMLQRFLNARICKYSVAGLARGAGRHDPFEELRSAIDHFEPEVRRQRYRDALAFLPKPAMRDVQQMSLELIDTTLHSLLWRNDRMGMMHSIESRFPYLDEAVLRFGVNLPTKFKVRHTRKTIDKAHPFLMDKFVVRKLAERKLPDTLSRKRKHPFTIGSFNSIRIDPQIFEGGYVQQVLRMSSNELRGMATHLSRPIVARLLGLDIWTRLYLGGESIEATTNLVQKHCSMPMA